MTATSSLFFARNIERMIVDDVSRAEGELNRFFFQHLSIPHFPYVLDRAGLRSDFYRARFDESSYLEQVEYADAYLGRILGAFDSHGQFEDCLLIVTADHVALTTRGSTERRHVPLFVKLPHQNVGQDHHRPVRTLHTRDMIRSFLDRDDDPLARLDCRDCDLPEAHATTSGPADVEP